MVKVLHELGNLDGGGVARLLYDYYRNMDRREELKFDFIISDKFKEGILEQPLKDLGCTVYKIPLFKNDRKGAIRSIEQIIKNGNYDVVHTHKYSRGLFALWFAKKYGIKKRLIHSHIAYEDVGLKSKTFNHILSNINAVLATDLFACGTDAGIYAWGKSRVNAGKVKIMTNAVDTHKFLYNSSMRTIKRKELGIDGKFVIGNVGRLNKQKNQGFLLDCFADVLKKHDEAVLVIAGRGEEEQSLKKQADALNITRNVMFLGIRDDVPDLSNAFDLFVMPSLYEGLPVSVVEAQANGLRVLTSDKVTREVAVTDLIDYLPLDKNVWVEAISNEILKFGEYDRGGYAEKVEKAGYDIIAESRRMERFYINGEWIR